MSNTTTYPTRQTTTSPSEGLENALALGLLLVLGPVSCLIAWGLSRIRDTRWRIALAAIGTAGAGYLYLVWARIEAHIVQAIVAVRQELIPRKGHRAPDLQHLLTVEWHDFRWGWTVGILAAPLLSQLIALRGPKREGPLGEDDERDERKQWKREQRVARKAVTTATTPDDRRGLFLGYRLAGDDLLPARRGKVFLPWRLTHHPMLILGATGSGKTETLLRIAYSTALATDTQIVYLDGKGDRRNEERFCELMRDAGRNVRCFPEERFDGWRGDADEQTNRLLELIDYAQEGGGTYYRDLAVRLVRLACQAPGGPPRSSGEFLDRLDARVLAALYARDGEPEPARLRELDSLQPHEVAATRARYEAFFGTLKGTLDGQLHFDQLDAGYFLLDGLRLKYEAGFLARFLVEDFTQWAAGTKPHGQRVLLIVDEFSAIAQAASALVDVVERTRGFDVTTIVAPQVAEGMGGPEASARIIGSAATVILHRLPMPEELVRIAGSRRVQSMSQQLEGDVFTGLGSVRLQHEYRVNPNEVRHLRVGQGYVISDGRAQKVQVVPATVRRTN